MSEMIPKVELTRRQFLKVSAATAALATVGGKLFNESVSSLVRSDQISEAEIVPSYCKMCIGPACGMLVQVKNGIVTDVRGDPAHLANEGKLCPRGNANVFNLYNPYRLKAPLKRTNPEKGLDVDPRWVEITWAEAMDTVEAELARILTEDPRGLVFHLGFGSMRDDVPMARPIFPIAFGTPNKIESNGPLCAVHFGSLANLGSFTYALDPTRINYLVCIGHSPGGDFTKSSSMAGLHGVSTEALQNALDRGMKLVIVNPHAGSEAMRAEWVPVLPGMDLPFILAMCNVILHEMNKYDEWFLRVRTNAPYLIRQDGHYARDPESGKPLMWSTISDKVVPFDHPEVSDGRLSDPSLGGAALLGSYQANGEQVTTAFEIIREHLRAYTPEWAEELSTIPAVTIRRIARELVEAAQIGSTIQINGFTFPYRPAAVFAGRGAISHRGGNYVMLAVNLINGLLGATDVPGGLTGESFNPLLAPGADGTVEPNPRLVPHTVEWLRNPFEIPVQHFDLSEFYPHKHCTPFVAWRAITDPAKYHIDYKAKALIVFGANPITNMVNAEEPIAAFRQIPFVTSIAYHLDEPSQFADIILAESANMERLNFIEFQACGPVAGKRGLAGLNFRHPVIGPLYDTRDANSILLDLANRLGIHPAVNSILNGMLRLKDGPFELVPPEQYKWEEIVDRVLKARYGVDKGIDYFTKHGSAWTMAWLPEEKTYNYYYFPDGQTRHPLYCEYLLESGKIMEAQCAENNVTVPGWDMDKYLAFFKALPIWIPHPEHEAPKEFDLYAVNWKIGTRAFGMGGFEELAQVRETQLKQSLHANSILLNTATAREKGLQDGDEVICESQYGGQINGVVLTTELLHLKAVGFPGNFGRTGMFLAPEAKVGANYNQLLSASDGEFDPVIGGIDITAAVRLIRV
jgi:anaerobic selenocysteine-containing dehydrogenase